MTFEIEVGAMVTIQEGNSFVIEAANLDEAKKKAMRLLEDQINDKYQWCDYDDGDFLVGYTNQVG